MKRIVYQTIISRLKEPRKFIQVLFGPRQVGKREISSIVVACDWYRWNTI